MNEWKKPDYEKIKADGLKLIDEAEKTGDITKYYEAVDEFTNSFYDGHMGISFYDGNDYRITRIKQFNDYGLSLITLDDGTTIAVDVEDGLEIKNGDTVTKWNGVPIDQAIENGNVRGTINVAEHIRKNTPFIGNISYSQREYSYDNYLIELIRHTIEYIKGKNYGRMLLNSVKDEVKLITEATPNYKAGNRRKIIEANRKNVVRHAYYHEYRALQQLCILILKNEQHQYGNGARKVYGILFDGAWLWEEYVNSLIGEIFYHPMNKAGSGAQRLFSGNYGFIYPDFISKSESNRVIADAKYKPIDNIGNKDYLQVLAYMFRFDAKKGFFLYPESGDIQDLLLSLNKGTTYENNVAARDDIAVIKHGLKIPFDASDYAEFSEKMKAEEERFMTIFS